MISLLSWMLSALLAPHLCLCYSVYLPPSLISLCLQTTQPQPQQRYGTRHTAHTALYLQRRAVHV
jgi:hypothetical protein